MHLQGGREIPKWTSMYDVIINCSYDVCLHLDADESGIFKSIIGKIKDTVPNIKSATTSIIPTQHHDNKNYQFYAGNERSAVSHPSSTLWGFGNTSNTNSESKTGILF